MMIVGTVPIVVLGLAFKNQIETQLRSLYVIAAAMIVLAVVLAGAELLMRWRQRHGLAEKHLADITWADALVMERRSAGAGARLVAQRHDDHRQLVSRAGREIGRAVFVPALAAIDSGGRRVSAL